MKKVLLIAVLALQGFGVMAQKPERIESPIISEKDSAWYEEQKELWKVQTQKDPTDETAWRNYYKAARYTGWLSNEDNSAAHQAIVEMSKKGLSMVTIIDTENNIKGIIIAGRHAASKA